MPTQILMPALSPTMEEGTLVKWLVKEGQDVKSGDVIAEIETDKATMEVEAVDEGRLSKILIPAGTEGVKVNTPIAVIDTEDDSEESQAGDIPDTKPAAIDKSHADARPFDAEDRYRGHSMSDPAKYRTREEVQKMRETHDPIEHVREQLLREGLTDDELKKIDRQMRDVVNAAADFALSDTEPDPTELYTDVVVAD